MHFLTLSSVKVILKKSEAFATKRDSKWACVTRRAGLEDGGVEGVFLSDELF